MVSRRRLIAKEMQLFREDSFSSLPFACRFDYRKTAWSPVMLLSTSFAKKWILSKKRTLIDFLGWQLEVKQRD